MDKVNQVLALFGHRMEPVAYRMEVTDEEGGKFRFIVPAELAWGKRGAGVKIGPHAALIFDIRLEKVTD
jgi:hypothetical protein